MLEEYNEYAISLENLLWQEIITLNCSTSEQNSVEIGLTAINWEIITV